MTRQERRREAARKRKRIDPSCPRELVRDVDVMLAGSLAGKQISLGEKLGSVVNRICPQIFSLVSERGFVISFDLPENTHEALCVGLMTYSIRRQSVH